MTNTQREWEAEYQRSFPTITLNSIHELHAVAAKLQEYQRNIPKLIAQVEDKARAEGAAAEREKSSSSVVKLFSGKKVLISNYIPRDEVWVGNGKTRNEILQSDLLNMRSLDLTKDKGEDVSSNNTV